MSNENGHDASPDGAGQPGTFMEPTPASGKRRRRLLIGALAGVAGLATAGLVFGAMGNNEVGDEPRDQGQEQVDPNQGTGSGYEAQQEMEAQREFEAFIDSFDIDRASYATFEDVARAYLENYEKWMNAGLTLQYDMTLMAGDSGQTASLVQDRFDSLIIDRMYQTNPKTQSALQDTRDNLRPSIITAFRISQNIESIVLFAVDFNAVNIEVVSSDADAPAEATSFTVRIETNLTDNGPDSIAANRIANGHPVQTDIIRYEEVTFTLDSATNTWKIGAVQRYAESVDNSH